MTGIQIVVINQMKANIANFANVIQVNSDVIVQEDVSRVLGYVMVKLIA